MKRVRTAAATSNSGSPPHLRSSPKLPPPTLFIGASGAMLYTKVHPRNTYTPRKIARRVAVDGCKKGDIPVIIKASLIACSTLLLIAGVAPSSSRVTASAEKVFAQRESAQRESHDKAEVRRAMIKHEYADLNGIHMHYAVAGKGKLIM